MMVDVSVEDTAVTSAPMLVRLIQNANGTSPKGNVSTQLPVSQVGR